MRRLPVAMPPSNPESVKFPLTSSIAHHWLPLVSTTTTVLSPRANDSARAVRKVATKSPVAEAKLPRDLRRLKATADSPARIPTMASVTITSTMVKPRGAGERIQGLLARRTPRSKYLESGRDHPHLPVSKVDTFCATCYRGGVGDKLTTEARRARRFFFQKKLYSVASVP